MQVEDVTRVGLAARRAAQQQRDGPVRLGLLGQVVEDDQDVLAVVHPVLADRAAGVGGDVLVAGRVGGGRGHDRGVLHRPGLFERLLDRRRSSSPSGRSRRRRSAPGWIGSPDAQLSFWLMIVSIAIAVLPVCRSPMISWRWPRPIAVIASMALMPVCSGSFTGCRCTTDGAWSLQGAQRGVLDRAEAVERLAERADHPAEERVADRDGEHLAGPLDLLALLDLGELAEDDDADLAHVEVQREAADAVLELKKLVRHGRGQALDARDAVAALDDRADLFTRDTSWLVLFDEPRQRVADLIRPDCQLRHLPHSVRVIQGRLCTTRAGLRAGRIKPRQPASLRRTTARRLAAVPSISSSPIWTDTPPMTAGSCTTFR